MKRTMVSAVLLTVLLSAPAWANRLHMYTRMVADPTNPVTPVAISYCGGPGTEYLSGAVFMGNGDIVAAGTAIGAPLRLGPAVEFEVLGRDAMEPLFDAGAIQQKDVAKHLTWNSVNRTPFVVWLSGDLQEVKRAVRLPWRSGSVTGIAADKDGGVYIAGLAGDTLSCAGAAQDVSDEPACASTAYVAKLAPDLSRIEWIRTFTDAGKGPRIRVNARNEIGVEGGWLYVFAPDGRRTHVTKLQKIGKWIRAVNPEDHTYAVGGESRWGTGREPWRCPRLQIGMPEKTYEMFYWPGPLVGINSLRLVSDSSVTYLHMGDDRLLYVIGWADGGNSCFRFEPTDLRRPVRHPGMKFDLSGVGATSFCHFLKINPVTGRTEGYTIWSAFRGNDGMPNGIRGYVIQPATDGSALIAGGSAFGLLQTGDAVHTGDPGGNYIAIFEPDLSAPRFCSIVPGICNPELRSGESFAVAAGRVNGRHRALFVSGATREGETYTTGPHPAPTLNPFQAGFGGGLSDGWIALFDLGPADGKAAAGDGRVAK